MSQFAFAPSEGLLLVHPNLVCEFVFLSLCMQVTLALVCVCECVM